MTLNSEACTHLHTHTQIHAYVHKTSTKIEACPRKISAIYVYTVKRNFLANDRNMYAAASCNDHFYNRCMSEGLRVKHTININKKHIKLLKTHKILTTQCQPTQRKKNYDSFSVPVCEWIYVCEFCDVSCLKLAAVLTQYFNFHLFLLNFRCATIAYKRVRLYTDIVSLTHILHMLFLVALAQNAQTHAQN